MEQQAYSGKKFSILGDSISTFEGFQPPDYHLFYTKEVCERAGIHTIADTWWGKVIDHFGGRLLANNSWSGSRVTQMPNRSEEFPSGCSQERTGQLHIGAELPDVILVYLGLNDWGYGVPLHRPFLAKQPKLCYFDTAYRTMLRRLRKNYPKAAIWCCTLNPTTMAAKPSFVFPFERRGTHLDAYNQIIRTTTAANRCQVLDLYRWQTPNDTLDGSHPTAQGMAVLAELVIRSAEASFPP